MRPRFVIAVTLGLVCCVGLVSLGNWQVARRAWKLELIEHVNTRVHAAPVPAPGPPDWADITAANSVYRHVRVQGVFLNERQTRVQALTEAGAGDWLLTPLQTPQGFVVLVNRGFVPTDWHDTVADSAVTVVGLIRMTEPNGGFLQTNDPATDHWYSRDIAAIVKRRGLTNVAPYFIDADDTPNPGGYPLGGLTVIDFPNNHLVYAITWYTLAIMVAGAVVFLGYVEVQDRAS